MEEKVYRKGGIKLSVILTLIMCVPLLVCYIAGQNGFNIVVFAAVLILSIVSLVLINKSKKYWPMPTIVAAFAVMFIFDYVNQFSFGNYNFYFISLLFVLFLLSIVFFIVGASTKKSGLIKGSYITFGVAMLLLFVYAIINICILIANTIPNYYEYSHHVGEMGPNGYIISQQDVNIAGWNIAASFIFSVFMLPITVINVISVILSSKS